MGNECVGVLRPGHGGVAVGVLELGGGEVEEGG